MSWTDSAVASVTADPSTVATLFPAARRNAAAEGRDGDEVRAELLLALGPDTSVVEVLVANLYRHGDSAEKCAVLKALPLLDDPGRPGPLGDRAVALVRDALRSNDNRLVAIAMGGYAAEHLDDAAWRQGVVKCLFMGIPLHAVAGLDDRNDDELRRMVTDYAAERTAAGRSVPADAERLLRDQTNDPLLIEPTTERQLSRPLSRQPS